MNKKNTAIFLFFLVFGLTIGYFVKDLFLPNVRTKTKNNIVYIYKNSTIDVVADSLQSNGMISNKQSFLKAAKYLGYGDDEVLSGRYIIDNIKNNFGLIKKLKSGKQDPLNLVLNPIRKVEELSGILGKKLIPDSIAFLALFYDSSYCKEAFQLNKENILSIFIPNTYEIFWTIEPKDFMKKMKKESDRFWRKAKREEKLKQLGWKKEDVYTLASIVDRETHKDAEKPDIAGLYLNRIQNGMPLQADPTVVYANGDFGLKRILEKHLNINSPYNTYINKGLPPGPIGIATISGIDAVLANIKHSYLYMCARPDYSGLHDFSTTFQEHVRKANVYRNWLTSQGL